jgi:hypothetical protein
LSGGALSYATIFDLGDAALVQLQVMQANSAAASTLLSAGTFRRSVVVAFLFGKIDKSALAAPPIVGRRVVIVFDVIIIIVPIQVVSRGPNESQLIE